MTMPADHARLVDNPPVRSPPGHEAFEAVFEGALDAMMIAADDGTYLLVNAAACELFGRSRDELLRAGAVELRESGMIRTPQTWEGFLGEGLSEGEVEITRPDGEVRVAEYRATADILPGMHLSVLRDVTERRATDEQLRASRELYELVVTNSQDLITLLDMEGRILYSSPSTLEVLGDRGDVTGKPFAEHLHPDDLARARENIARMVAGEPREPGRPIRIRAADGSWVLVEGNGSVIRDRDGKPTMILTTARDVTLRERAHELEQQLQQSQKLEAVGQLAGGVAHDFNNLLMAIIGYSDLALEQLGEEQRELTESLGEIRRAADRGAGLTRQLLAYSRRQVLDREILDLNAVVSELGPMLSRLLGEDVRVVLELEPEAGFVLADRGQLGQVLVNLAVNARDAMPDGGLLIVSTRLRRSEDEDAVEIVVQDTGIGMDAETQARIFEPFYTTKPVGTGTGLGLATVFGIVEQTGGSIAVESARGGGTTFTIVLPEAGACPERTAETVVAGPVGGGERVLVVEDDRMVRSIINSALLSHGYDVRIAADPLTALELAAETRFDLVLTDVVMPELNGRELVERLLPLQPHLRVVYMSGYPGDAVTKRGVELGGGAFLQKPFSLAQLAERIRESLDA